MPSIIAFLILADQARRQQPPPQWWFWSASGQFAIISPTTPTDIKSPQPAFDPPAGVLIIDNDQAHAVAANAIPGTIRIPLGELRSRLDELPRDREIWVHCGVGQNSYYAVRLLKQHGFQVRNLSGGMTSYKMER